MEKDLKKLIQELMDAQPELNIDQAFVKELREQLMAEIPTHQPGWLSRFLFPLCWGGSGHRPDRSRDFICIAQASLRLKNKPIHRKRWGRCPTQHERPDSTTGGQRLRTSFRLIIGWQRNSRHDSRNQHQNWDRSGSRHGQ